MKEICIIMKTSIVMHLFIIKGSPIFLQDIWVNVVKKNRFDRNKSEPAKSLDGSLESRNESHIE